MAAKTRTPDEPLIEWEFFPHDTPIKDLLQAGGMYLVKFNGEQWVAGFYDQGQWGFIAEGDLEYVERKCEDHERLYANGVRFNYRFERQNNGRADKDD